MIEKVFPGVFDDLTLDELDAYREMVERKLDKRSREQAALECDDCGRTDGTHNMEVEH